VININSHARNEPSDHLSVLALNVLVEPHELSCTDPILSSVIFTLDFPKKKIQISLTLLQIFVRVILQPCLLLNLRNLRETFVHHRPFTPGANRGAGLLHPRAKSLFLWPKGTGSYGTNEEMQVLCEAHAALYQLRLQARCT